jgi:hypothetical protein
MRCPDIFVLVRGFWVKHAFHMRKIGAKGFKGARPESIWRWHERGDVSSGGHGVDVGAMMQFLENRRDDITKELAAENVPKKSMDALVKNVIEAGTYAARHEMAISEQNDLADSLGE